MTNETGPTGPARVYVCCEPGCAPDEELRRLCTRLAETATVTEVGCQDICGGPLVGVRAQGRLRWLAPVDTEARTREVVAVLRGAGSEALPPELAALVRTKHAPVPMVT
jgi:hypothetical protein